MGTLFKTVLSVLAEGLDDYTKTYEVFKYITALNLSKKVLRSENFLTGLDSTIEISYYYYKKWLETHDDLQIGANYLTNLQLFFVANAVTTYTKYNPLTPKTFGEYKRLYDEYLHFIYKIGNRKAFFDAFKCNVTNEEEEKINEYKRKFHEWHGTNLVKVDNPNPKSNVLEYA